MDEDVLLSEFTESNRKLKKQLKIFIPIIIILAIVCLVFLTLYILELQDDDDDDKKDINNDDEKKDDDKKDDEKKDSSPLSLWKDGDAKTKIINFINSSTVENSDNFLPKEDRIAVFDFDGTIYQETAPTYLDFQLYLYRVKEDPKYDATSEQTNIAEKILESINTGKFPDDLSESFYKESAKIFQNMTLDEYDKYIKQFLKKPVDGFNNLSKGNAFYKPMIELIQFLYKNDFLVYIVSGSERFLVRAAIDQHINIPANYIIGSEVNIISSNQNNMDNLNYTFETKDELIFDGEFISKNLFMNKVYHIITEIGKRPVLSFGNSFGDASMHNFAISNKKYKSMAFMIINDDTKNENGNIDKAKEMLNTCQKNKWVPISMKDDWQTIYGDNVTKVN